MLICYISCVFEIPLHLCALILIKLLLQLVQVVRFPLELHKIFWFKVLIWLIFLPSANTILAYSKWLLTIGKYTVGGWGVSIKFQDIGLLSGDEEDLFIISSLEISSAIRWIIIISFKFTIWRVIILLDFTHFISRSF